MNLCIHYDTSIDLLNRFVVEKDLRSYALTFKKQNISTTGIRDCFRLVHDKNESERIFKEACDNVDNHLLK